MYIKLIARRAHRASGEEQAEGAVLARTWPKPPQSNGSAVERLRSREDVIELPPDGLVLLFVVVRLVVVIVGQRGSRSPGSQAGRRRCLSPRAVPLRFGIEY